MLVTDLIAGRQNPWPSLYDPSRKVKHGLPEYFSEQANVVTQARTPDDCDKAVACS